MDTIRLGRGEDCLPYQTTSQQAMETLASGVGFGAPRHIQPLLASKLTKKRRKSRRFTLCGCGGKVEMYDEGLSTAFVASSSPRKKIIERIRAGSFTQTAIPPMPPVEFYKATQAGLHRRKRSKTSERDQRLANLNHSDDPFPPLPLKHTCLKQSPVNRVSPQETLLSTSYEDSNASAISCVSPRAQLVRAIRANVSETTLTRGSIAVNCVPAHRVALQRTLQSSPTLPTCASPEGLSAASTFDRPKSSVAVVCDASVDIQRKEVRQKRRGGFLSVSADTIPNIDVDLKVEASTDDVTSHSIEIIHSSEGASSRLSLASTLSKYSTMSPYLDSSVIPSRASMGGVLSETFIKHRHQNHHQFPTPASVSSRSSVISTQRSLSIGANESPAIGEVLSHFPSLTDMYCFADSGKQLDRNSGCDSSRDNPEDHFSSRINTFGPGRRLLQDYNEIDDTPHLRKNSLYFKEPSHNSRLSNVSPTSTEISFDSESTPSSSQSKRSNKRAAVFCSLPLHGDLASLSQDNKANGLTWQEKLLELSKSESQSGMLHEYDLTSCEGANVTAWTDSVHSNMSTASKETIRRHRANRSRGSSTSQAPFSPPPNLPLPPVPTKRRGGNHIQSLNSTAIIDLPSTKPQTIRATLPRSITCPNLANSAYAY